MLDLFDIDIDAVEAFEPILVPRVKYFPHDLSPAFTDFSSLANGGPLYVCTCSGFWVGRDEEMSIYTKE